MACRRCCNSIFILDHSVDGLDKNKCKTRRETMTFWDLVRLIVEVWRYSGRTVQISWLQMSRWSKEPGHQQPLYWLCRIIWYFSARDNVNSQRYPSPCWEMIENIERLWKFTNTSMASVCPLLTHWRYRSLALNHRCVCMFPKQQKFCTTDMKWTIQ